MSLNRCEDALLAYVKQHPDEHRYWTARVDGIARSNSSREARADALERDLRSYAAERARADDSLRDALGAGHVRLRNLAEYLLQIWGPPLHAGSTGPRAQRPR